MKPRFPSPWRRPPSARYVGLFERHAKPRSLRSWPDAKAVSECRRRARLAENGRMTDALWRHRGDAADVHVLEDDDGTEHGFVQVFADLSTAYWFRRGETATPARNFVDALACVSRAYVTARKGPGA